MVYLPPTDPKWIEKPILVDITNKCTLQCFSCIRQIPRRYEHIRHLYKDMPLEDFKKLLKFFPDVIICGQQSDPIFHPRFVDFVKAGHDHKIRIHTAASHRPREFYEEAFHYSGMKTTWVFGLDGLPEESHRHRINQDGVHLYEMMKLGARMGVDIMWQYLIFNYNQDHFEQAKVMAEGDGITLQLRKSNRWANWEDHELKPDDELCDWREFPKGLVTAL